MGIWSKIKTGVSKVGSKIRDAADKATNVVDKVTDNQLFEVSANMIGSAYGVPNAGSMIRKGVNTSQELVDGNLKKAIQASGLLQNNPMSKYIQPIQSQFNQDFSMDQLNDYKDYYNNLDPIEMRNAFMMKQMRLPINNSMKYEYQMANHLMQNPELAGYNMQMVKPMYDSITDRSVYDSFNF